jgi:CDP-diacylglycerol--glycerol-3-phosphate 3-phosphatidyltransferase
MTAPVGPIRHLPNIISALRILAAPVLVALALTRHETAFAALLIPALISDIIDGYLARRLAITSALGALLDSVADLLLFAVAVVGIASFHPELLAQHRLACGILLACWLSEPLVALARYGRISSFHTYASKAAAYLLGFMVAVLFLWGLPDVLFYTAVGAGILASAEEFLLIALLPEWRANVRGIYWVLREAPGATA